MHSVVEKDVEVRLAVSRENSVPVPARLVYRTDDPYAVHITFHLGSAAPVTWTFARDLLMEGAFRASGEGDVRVFPGKEGGRAVVCVLLSSPDGSALLRVRSGEVGEWLERTLRIVPPGRERAWLGLERGLRELLASGA
ncbi:sporulation protein SsgA [Streptomyces mashuensis]|uniref:Sporulation protein SsgA n=1 Tax=Streptomyces mashuensis TaxID=33904 RepID=A0A919B137_9ACTN|nr:SsgA family sporulation/cell division regulator [Streptomyces mashuensis]GHF37064.1 sporulation protein SsgA [Streptomyces mashuensis]